MGDKCTRFLIVTSAVCVGMATSAIAQSVAIGPPEGAARGTMVTLDVRAGALKSVLWLISQQAGLELYASGDEVLRSKRVTLHVRGVSASEAFAQALAGTKLKAIIEHGIVRLTRDAGLAPPGQGGIDGKIIDAKSKQPLWNATVVLDDNSVGTQSRNDGSFSFANITPGAHIIHVRMIGYLRATKPVTVIEGSSVSVEVFMEPSVSALDQVVVTGTVAATELKAVPNAITVITGQELAQRNVTHIDQLFRGDIPGLFVSTPSSGTPLGQVRMYARGNTQMDSNQPKQPIKTYVDGVELADPSYLSQIDPKSIERIEILTGPQASTIYGSNALNGVMQIFTKRGSSMTPQFAVTLQSGSLQTNLSSAVTPQHNEGIQVNGTDGHVTYNAGGSGEYTGRWTPSVQMARTSGYGGVRVVQGPVSADISMRIATTANRARGNTFALSNAYYANGFYPPQPTTGILQIGRSVLTGNTIGTTLNYAPSTWWSQEFGAGTDASNVESSSINPYATPGDSLPYYSQTQESRRSLRSTTTLRVPIADMVQATVIAGVDGWNTNITSISGATATLTGNFSNNPGFSRQLGHNRGAFVQGQLGIYDALFVTYGMREEWNPNYGKDAEPNVAPRYGLAYTHEFGQVTTKVRASYGRATRPPLVGAKSGIRMSTIIPTTDPIILDYGDFYLYLPNPALGPESQRGDEEGVEVYLGNRGSLLVTRYNQTVDDLIYRISPVDSVRSFLPCDPSDDSCDPEDAQGYGYFRQQQYLNVGRIRNQGWELQGHLNTGPFTTRGTYSWTKSRFLNAAPKFWAAYGNNPIIRALYAPGATFDYLPEHTWATTITYARGATSASMTMNGIGSLRSNNYYSVGNGRTRNARLQADHLRMQFPNQFVVPDRGYATADVNASQQLSSRVWGLLAIKNVTDYYHEDLGSGYAVLGRQTLAGFRIRW